MMMEEYFDILVKMRMMMLLLRKMDEKMRNRKDWMSMMNNRMKNSRNYMKIKMKNNVKERKRN
jgi:hypothetical protein